MKFTGTLIGTASGSLAGTTFSHNKGGQYTRRRAIPTNPNTAFQQAVRGIFADLGNRWVNNLTNAQRDAWTVYATNVSLVDALGNSIHVNPMSMYQRSNVSRVQAGKARVDDGPTVYDVGSFTNPTFAGDASADTLDVSFTNTDAWASEVGAYMFVLASRPQNPTINYFKGPYRFTGSITGAASPPTSPQTFPLPFAAALGQKVFAQVVVSRADGRLSYPFQSFCTVAA